MSETTNTTTNTTTKGVKHERTYAQFCPIAAGLDLVGDRWVLLICRELSFGDQRFTDLRNALARIAPNLLSERLRSLQDAGLVVSAELPPPAARAVYRLTAEGRRVIPVLRAMARFGAPYLDGEPGTDFDARRAAYSLLAPWWRAPAEPRSAPLRYRLVLARSGTDGYGTDADAVDRVDRVDLDSVDLDSVDLLLEGRGLRIVAAEPGHEPDALVVTTVDGLAAARRGDGVLAADVTGARDAVQSFFAAFALRPAGA